MAQCLLAQSIVKSFGSMSVLHGVTIAVDRGETVGLLGSNGAGKTTLVNIVSGYERQNSGSVEIDGVSLDGLTPEARAHKGLARTFQSGRLFRDLSVAENVILGALGVGASKKIAVQRAEKAMTMLDLNRVATQQAGGLPHGLSRLTGLARALTAEPKYLIMDEPAAGLNEHEVPGLLRALERIRVETGCGMLLIEHNVGLVAAACSKVFVLGAGELLFEGAPADALKDEGVLAAYLGDAAMGLPGGAA